MTNSIAFTTTTNRTNQEADMFLVTANLIKTVAHNQVKIEKSLHQLLLISRSSEESSIERKAEKYLKRQNKLAEIAAELKNRMIAQIATGTMTNELEARFIQEVDILNWMHFEVAKSYTSFINQNFEARIISLLRPIAA